MEPGTHTASAEPLRQSAWGLVPAAGVSASAVLLFWLQLPLAGYLTLAGSIAIAAAIDRALAADLLLIGIGIGIVSTISVAADISYANMLLMGMVLALAVAVPTLIERFGYRRRSIRFPIRTGKRWSALQRVYLLLVVLPRLGDPAVLFHRLRRVPELAAGHRYAG